MGEAALGVGPRSKSTTTTRSHSHSSSIWSGGDRRFQFQLHTDRTPPLHLALGYLRGRLSQTHLDRQQYFYAGVVSFQSKDSPVAPVDVNQSDLYSGAGAGGGSDHNKGESDKKKMAISMSQQFTLGYAALLGVGGVMGYLKGGSQKSLLAGGVSASLLYYVYTELPERPVLASSVGLGISGALTGMMGARYKRTGKVFPAGVVSLVSLVMTGGYLHGIWRGMQH